MIALGISPEHPRGVFTTTCYTNPRQPLPYLTFTFSYVQNTLRLFLSEYSAHVRTV